MHHLQSTGVAGSTQGTERLELLMDIDAVDVFYGTKNSEKKIKEEIY